MTPKPAIYALGLLGLLVLATPGHAAGTEDSKRLVQQLYEMAFLRREPARAAALYLGQTYLQHNPRVPDGPAAFASFFESFMKQNPTSSADIKRIVADRDLVIVHSHSRRSSEDRGMVVVDIFRVEDGKIVEHWDVMQPVPETTVSGRPVF